MDSPENKDRRRPGAQRGRDDQKPQPKLWGSGRSMIFWLALFLLVFVVYQYFAGFDQTTAELTYTEFVQEVDSSNVAEVTFADREIEGKFVKPKTFASSRTNEPATQVSSRAFLLRTSTTN